MTNNKKFFPAYLYVASRLISEQQEFRIANLDNELGYYEVLHPSYSAFLQTKYNILFRHKIII